MNVRPTFTCKSEDAETGESAQLEFTILTFDHYSDPSNCERPFWSKKLNLDNVEISIGSRFIPLRKANRRVSRSRRLI
jgi:hypothetical protein